MNFDYYIPTRILFGPGRIKEISNLVIPWKKAMIVITNGNSMKKHGYLDTVIQGLKDNDVEVVVYDKVPPNPTTDCVMEAIDIARKEGCDFIIGLGGGSAIDAAKAIAVGVKNDGDIWDYVKGKTPDNGALPIIAIPSTAGTGTESDPWSVLTKTEINEKVGFGYDEMFPFMSIVDPEIMATVPPRLTAFQGIDALCHAVEGYLATVCQPASEIYALDSIMIISKFLKSAVKNGFNYDAREQIAWASTQSGFVESTSMCISQHAIEHAMSAYYPNLTHGAGLAALIVPYFTKLLEKGDDRLELKYMNMAMAMGKDISSISPKFRAKAFVEALEELLVSIDLGNLSLSQEFGLNPEDADKIATNAQQSMGFLFEVDPVHLSHVDVVNIVKNAIN